MSWLAFILGIVLTLAGAVALGASIDLQGTDRGLEYSLGGAIAVSVGFIILAIAALIRRVDALGRACASLAREPVYADSPAQYSSAPPFEAPHSAETTSVAAPAEEDEPINENRAGHLPSLTAIEHALQEPEAAPTLVGRYSAGGANYMIFSDGTIEAETDQGAFRFASMNDFKKYLAGGKE
jgi:hypothetical protein